MRKLFFIALMFSILSSFSNGSRLLAGDLVISEVIASNLTSNYDESYYNFGDWIEIYNTSDRSYNLQDYYLTDDPENLFKYKINQYFYLSPGQHRIFWADSYDSYHHTNFSIDSDGEFIALVDPVGNILDSVTIRQQYPDISYGRNNSHSEEWQYFDNPTPGSSNGTGISEAEFSEELIFSLEPGFYEDDIILELNTDTPVDEIRYTLDGSFPNRYSSRYTDPISLSKNRTVRALTYTSGKLPSAIQSNSYFIDEDSLTLPAISISTPDAYLTDPMIGIYVEGENGKIDNCIDSAMNFNQDWERPVNLEYFLPSGEQVLNQMAGVKINGGCSRNVPSKSFAVYAREKYGDNRLRYPLFANKDIPEYKNIILRNAGNDYYYCYMRDGVMQTLIAGETDIDYQSYQPVRVYINGDYWGILNMREKENEHYLAANHGVDPDNVDLIESNSIVIEGDYEHYGAMMEYLRSHDIEDSAAYAHMCSQMEMSQFIDYYIAEIYYENEDWPGHNIKCWRPKTEGAKWRWLLYDTDYGFGRWPRTGNTVNWAFMKNWKSTELGATLGDNQDFADEFCQRFAARLSTTLHTDRVLHILDSLKNNITTEMHLHIGRWGSPWAHWHWLDNVEVMEDFAQGRSALMYEQLKDKFHLAGTFSLLLQSADSSLGKIELHDILLDSATEATLFRNVPIRINAVPENGFQFSHWSGASTSSLSQLSITLSANDTLTAHFRPAEPIEGLYITEFSSSAENGILDEYGESEDWIEIYNGNPEAVVLDNLFLTDSLGDPFKHKIRPEGPALIIKPGEYQILYADKDPSQGKKHLNFKLSNQGETIALIQKTSQAYRIIDSASYLKQYPGASYGHAPNDPEIFQYLVPTPGEANIEKRIEGIMINEYMAANRSGTRDNHGEIADWIELYNAGDEAVSLSGAFFTDSLEDKHQHFIPYSETDSLILNPGGFMVFWADNQPEQGVRHLGFKLSGDGEAIGLVQPGGLDFIDSLSFGDLRQDVAIGSLPDGSTEQKLVSPTPGNSNKVELLRQIYINEVVAANRNTGADEFGEQNDWIEIHNANEVSVDVGGLYITDSLSYPTKFRIPSYAPDSTTIPPNGYLVLRADNTPKQGVLHLNFKLSSEGESIGLVQQDGKRFVNKFTYPELERDAAWGRFPEGTRRMQLLSPSPLDTNHVDSLKNLFINEFVTSNSYSHPDESGAFSDWIEIYNANSFAVDIGGLYFSDTPENPVKHKLPMDSASLTSIPAEGHLVLWADNQPEKGILHLGFRLNNMGEQIGLFLEDGRSPIDTLSYTENQSGAPLGRYPDGASTIEYMPASPGFPNYRKNFENLYISEICARGNSSYMDHHEEQNDWIEIYNNNDYSIDIGGAFLSDSLGAPTKHRIPEHQPDSTRIAPGEYLILWADKQPEQGVRHLDFALSGEGEELGLSTPDGKVLLDSIRYGDQHPDISFGRKSDTLFWELMRPTPGSSNVSAKVNKLLINEIMADNQNSLKDKYGNHSDWIEVYNPNDTPVDIGGYYLTDSLELPEKHRIPANAPDQTTLAAQGYLILFADDSTELGPLHTNFKLSRSGEALALHHFNRESLIDELNFEKQEENTAYAKPVNGTDWISMPPTPLAPNILPDFEGLYINELMPDNDFWLSDEHGEYDDWIELYNGSDRAMDVGGLFFSDSLDDKTQHRIASIYPDSTTLAPGGYLLLWADNDEEQGVLHLGFKLSKEGEEIGLFNFDGSLIDQINYVGSPSLSYGRIDNGHEDWVWFKYPSPGASNSLTALPEENADEISLMVFPNPMRDHINFVITTEKPETITLNIYMLSGEKVYTTHFTSNEQETSIEWKGSRGLSSGMYLYHVLVGKESYRGRIVRL